MFVNKSSLFIYILLEIDAFVRKNVWEKRFVLQKSYGNVTDFFVQKFILTYSG